MPSGYDLSTKVPFRLLKGRLGVYDKQPFDSEQASIDGIHQQYLHAQANGGNTQQERMIKDKRRSLDRAVWYSYQAAEIVKVDADERKPVRALINPNKLKQDYDDKVLSVGFEYDIHCGDVFEWLGTNTNWLIYLQDTTELAYFRGDIRKCSYKIAWEDENGLHVTYAAVRGPVETKINSSIKHGIVVDTPNYSLSLLMPKTDAIVARFKRYNKFYLQGDTTCWRVEAIDAYSTPGILEVTACEYYANETEDDIENGIVGGLIIEPENPNTQTQEIQILGETFIKVKKTYEFTFNGAVAADWSVDAGVPVTLIPCSTDPRKVVLKWNNSFSGQFDLHYGEFSKTIVVESLF